jgi:hypothetical protein
MLGLSESKILVKRAFDRGFIDQGWLHFEPFSPLWNVTRSTTRARTSVGALIFGAWGIVT